jgi:hypothetical protein
VRAIGVGLFAFLGIAAACRRSTPNADLDMSSLDGDASRETSTEAIVDSAATDAEETAASCRACASYGVPLARGPIPAVLHELSGLAASSRHRGMLYAHNDSGDTARLFALTTEGVVLAELQLQGAGAVDWEDVAVGPCSDESCIYVGDIGDNQLSRAEYTIYRIVEPEHLPADGGAVAVAYERFSFVYPDGPHNAETLLVDPVTGRVFVIVKDGAVAPAVYEMPTPLVGAVSTLTPLTSLALPPLAGVVTGGSFHPCGGRLLVRTYVGLYELFQPVGEPLQALFEAAANAVPSAIEAQGEAVTYAADGQGYFTAS